MTPKLCMLHLKCITYIYWCYGSAGTWLWTLQARLHPEGLHQAYYLWLANQHPFSLSTLITPQQDLPLTEGFAHHPCYPLNSPLQNWSSSPTALNLKHRFYYYYSGMARPADKETALIEKRVCHQQTPRGGDMLKHEESKPKRRAWYTWLCHLLLRNLQWSLALESVFEFLHFLVAAAVQPCPPLYTFPLLHPMFQQNCTPWGFLISSVKAIVLVGLFIPLPCVWLTKASIPPALWEFLIADTTFCVYGGFTQLIPGTDLCHESEEEKMPVFLHFHSNANILSSCNKVSIKGFPGGSDLKESAFNAGDLGLLPGIGRSPGEGNGNPLQYSCLEKSTDRGVWWGTLHGAAKSRSWLSKYK